MTRSVDFSLPKPEEAMAVPVGPGHRLGDLGQAAKSLVTNARRLVDVAGLVGAPILFTEQNPKGLGPTVAELAPDPSAVLRKMTFGAVGAPGFFERLAPGRDAVVGGWEAHVCVLQTVLALIEAGRRVFVVSDAVGSRRPESKEIALQRMARSGAEIVTMEMVVFEWLQTGASALQGSHGVDQIVAGSRRALRPR